ncbi:MAG: O-antigen ligase family protein [Mariniphaga sp.]
MSSRNTPFFFFLFFTVLVPYLPSAFPFLPSQIAGFNWTGVAWMMMLGVTLLYLPNLRSVAFPLWAWLPWMVYMIGALAVDFSFLGLQLTLQYLLPLLIGIVTSNFTYSEEVLLGLFKRLRWLTSAVVLLSFIYLLLFGYSPAMASLPMFLSLAASLCLGIYFLTKEIKFLVFFVLLFLFPLLNVTRMGIVAFMAIFVFHFANRNIFNKIGFGLAGLVLAIVVFNSEGFQKKTFGENGGKVNDLSVNYYDNDRFNNNGRNTWRLALEPGLAAAPVWGNGPRADYSQLMAISNNQLMEAHNDYLSVRYNYGYVGLACLLFGFGTTFLLLYGGIRATDKAIVGLLVTSTLTLFIPLLMFMYSDNILKYTIYFPNIFFAMVGIVFSIRKNGLEEGEEFENEII